jgi:chorismate mutase
MDISDWRKKIDEIDRRLAGLLNERARCTLEIGKLKRQQGRAILESRREDEVLRQAAEASDGPMDAAAMRRVFEAILRESREMQRKLFESSESESGK